MQRYDRVAISATRTNEGFIRDAPVVGRSGILKYMKDGKEYLEYRPPEEAFKKDSLASLQGKPITIGHKGMVDSKNAARIKPVGSVLSEGRQDGNNIVADVVIYNLDTAARELSCGYTVELDETPGVTPEGEHYDAVQRNIIYNHVAIVPEGRAGVARLNMDGEQEDESEEEKMSEKNYTKIRLDGGLEYEAAPEVAVYIEKIRADSKELSEKISALEVEKADALKKLSDEKDSLKAELTKEKDELQAKYDAAISDNEKIKKDAEKAAEDAKAKFDEAVKARVEMLSIAAKHKIEKADAMTDKEIKIAVIKSVRGEKFNLDGKSDDYISAAFDMAKDEVENREDALADQRKKVSGDKEDQKSVEKNDENNPEVALAELKKAEANFYVGEGK